ncbi:hypothetical protein GCM10011608_45710 [Micromonospora sonchi]|uniref:Uncharacterized protein n=1 Tax=Micromonospora sonchi TaxID=1763543 RepID=A0A917U3R9_9ACTN|nr:hypothetical protein GCM10011608_45710 [Micromonospora sonchi]
MHPLLPYDRPAQLGCEPHRCRLCALLDRSGSIKRKSRSLLREVQKLVVDFVAAYSSPTQIRPEGQQNLTFGIIDNVHPGQQLVAVCTPRGYLCNVVRVRQKEIRIDRVCRPCPCPATQYRDELGERWSERPVKLEPVSYVHARTVAEQAARQDRRNP